MKFAKILSLLLCFVLLASPALAQIESEKMQETLIHAKTMLSVPEEYTDFSYRSETDIDGTLYWYFSWSGEKLGNMEATLSEDGFLASYYAWVYTDSYDDSLANYTHSEAKEIAKQFIQTVNPDIYPLLREVTPDGENRDSRTQRYVFQEYLGDIPVYANIISVTVDRYHGIVRNYQGTKKTENFSDAAAAVTEEAAKAAYLAEIGIGLEYRLYYDYREKNYKIFPVYFLKDTSGKAIDGVTGQVIEPYFPESHLFGVYRGMNSMADMTMKEEAAGGIQFTPEELEAIANLEEIYSQEEALQLAIKKIPALKSFSLHTASLQRNHQDETKLFWTFRLKDEDSRFANVSLDAKTAQLLSFSLPSDTFQNQTVTQAEAKQIAEVFLKKEASDVFQNTQYTEENSRYIPYRTDAELPEYYWITYKRIENGIPVSGNQLSVRVDAKTKQVGAFERSWTDGVTFPDISACMTKEEIFARMDEEMEFCLTYLPTQAGYQKAYTFQNPDSQSFDPFTGKLLNYDGTEIAKTVLPEYVDIRGHWAEDMILTLLDNGYYFSGNEFRPEEAVTKKEFLQFFKMVGNDTDEQLNQLLATIEGESVASADCNAPLTKEVAAGYLMYRLGYQKVAELDHIFVYPFHDSEQGDPRWKGDISLAWGLGIFRGDENGNFHPKQELTRAQAASILYHFLHK